MTHCKLKKSIQKKLLEFFMLEVTVRSAADLLVIQPNSAILFYRKIREVISYHLALEADEVFDGQIELDESYFDGTRKGKRGRGAVGKTAVFGLLKCDGKVYTVVVPNSICDTFTDFYRSYDVLDVSEFNHFRINHSTHFAEKQNHVNGIENFWSQAKRHLRKFNGIPKAHFELYLKECEWRFNHGNLKSQISILKQLVKGSLS
ncbi:IS1595 family transposase [Glaesserella parasuis]|uniref:IS1595 family transposase n=1 Tax=Glaesserella parasuis TaxID=738 RepID=UPI0021BDAC39|nr:IS1595 family transposase [Glaesserella parasuis]MCT8678759.1 IS1595 family transposase [Glaesserella parasuis]MCT8818357.1 IS1595 family transposase [Glaesserella parasuis]MDO9754821.1 IS1595 family transposase [Glaesserella parasuis]